MRRATALLTAVTVLVLGAPAGAQVPEAPTGQGVNVVPVPDSPWRGPDGTYVELGDVTPGAPVTDSVLIRSSFDEDREVLLYGADAVPARGGGFGFDARDDTGEQVGAWLTVDVQSVVVPARGEVRVRWTIVVPPGTEGGEYVGAVVAEPSGQAPSGGGVATVTRFAMSVYLRVPGGAEGATPGRGSPDGSFVFEGLRLQERDDDVCPRIRYRNDSQDILDPLVKVVVDGPFSGARTYERRGGAVLPGTEADVELPCVRRPLGPGGTVEVSLSTPRGNASAEADAAWLPWPFVLACIALVLLVLALLLLLLRGLRRRRKEAPAEGAGT